MTLKLCSYLLNPGSGGILRCHNKTFRMGKLLCTPNQNAKETGGSMLGTLRPSNNFSKYGTLNLVYGLGLSGNIHLDSTRRLWYLLLDIQLEMVWYFWLVVVLANFKGL